MSNPSNPLLEDDAWGLERPGYSPTKFYTGASDAQGRMSSYRINVPLSIGMELRRLIESREIAAYQTVNDIVRDALTHRLHYLAEQRKMDRLERHNIAYQLTSDQERRRAEMHSLDEFIDQTAQTIQLARAKGDVMVLREVVEEAQEAAKAIREPYRGRLLKLLEDEQGVE